MVLGNAPVAVGVEDNLTDAVLHTVPVPVGNLRLGDLDLGNRRDGDGGPSDGSNRLLDRCRGSGLDQDLVGAGLELGPETVLHTLRGRLCQ